MKRTSVLILLVCAWTPPCLADEAENIRVAADMVAAINSRNLDQLDALVTSDIVRHSAATDGIVVASLDEFVALRAVYSGTQTGEVGPFPASGKQVELPYIAILRFSGGKISEMWVEWDNIFMLTQLGHFPSGP